MSNRKNVQVYRSYLNSLSSEIKNPEHGFFGPDSLAWQINREAVLGAGALRALLMQVAHPKVAQGIAEHSQYKTKPFTRAYNTLKAQQVIVFGTCEEATTALVRMYARHNAVSGSLPDNEADVYEGNDPYLQLWVLGTLIDTIIRGHELFLNPLSLVEKNQFYEESKWFARLMGISADVLPPTLNDFENWMSFMMEGEELAVSPEAQDIGQSLLRLPLPIFWPANYVLAVGMLPLEIREKFGLIWNEPLEKIYGLCVGMVGVVAKNLPIRLRTNPIYWKALNRAKAATIE